MLATCFFPEIREIKCHFLDLFSIEYRSYEILNVTYSEVEGKQQYVVVIAGQILFLGGEM